MLMTIIATKKEMTQTFLTDGTRVPVTKVKAGPCLVTKIKTESRDGYTAVQLGVRPVNPRKLTQPLRGQLRERSWPGTDGLLPGVLREARLESGEEANLEAGQLIVADQILAPGDLVDVTGISRGKGMTGVVKRWGFKGGPRTHGQSDRERAPGSIGQTTTPGRVYKGKKMAGRSGGSRVTIRNLAVLKVEKDGEVWLRGQIPGPRNGMVVIRKVGKGSLPAHSADQKPEGASPTVASATKKQQPSKNLQSKE